MGAEASETNHDVRLDILRSTPKNSKNRTGWSNSLLKRCACRGIANACRLL